MTPILEDDWLTIYGGDNREVMRTLPDESVQCVVTSPPYWGLRDYGTASWDGGDPDHAHVGAEVRSGPPGSPKQASKRGSTHVYSGDCRCGAIRQDRQLGLEQTPEEYVAAMVDVFREVKRILRRDGTLWINIGDTYASSAMDLHRVRGGRGQAWSGEGDVQEVLPPHGEAAVGVATPRAGQGPVAGVAPGALGAAERADPPAPEGTSSASDGLDGRGVPVLRRDGAAVPDAGSRPERRLQGPQTVEAPADGEGREGGRTARPLPDPLLELQLREGTGWLPSPKPKDLVGIPWRLAFALQADGWYLRSDIIWAKPNPMPESVTDRPTKSHEYLFLLSKSATYHYDADAVREEPAARTLEQIEVDRRAGLYDERGDGGIRGVNEHKPEGVHAVRDSRFRSRTMLNPAGRNRRSVWTIATKPYPGAHFATFPEALVEPCILAGTSEAGACGTCGAPWERILERHGGQSYSTGKSEAKRAQGLATQFSGYADGSSGPTFTTLGFRPTCPHPGDPVPCVVLDPFAGTGTVGAVAQRLSRRALLIDLNPDYLRQCLTRNQQAPLGLGH
jgi:DNA modification methylase